jgi:hypothetical protein
MIHTEASNSAAGFSSDITAYINNPTYLSILRDAAHKLLAMHDVAPRVVRYVASMQKWLITQAIVVIHYESTRGGSHPSLTAKSLIDFFAEQPLFSKNTLSAHLAEMRAYGLLVDQQTRDKRAKPLRLSDYAETMINQWLVSHLEALDQLDGVDRIARTACKAEALSRIHPVAVRRLIFDPRWAHPPENVDIFVRTESGSNILHDLICRLPLNPEKGNQPISLGSVRASEVSTRHTLSRGHVQRVFARAKDKGLLIWSLPGNRGELSVSQDLVRDYAEWQAIKFRAIAQAFDEVFANEHTMGAKNADKSGAAL